MPPSPSEGATSAAGAGGAGGSGPPSRHLPLRFLSTVVPGYGRGSRDLGIPTANVSQGDGICRSTMALDVLPTGIYWGYARIGDGQEGGEGGDGDDGGGDGGGGGERDGGGDGGGDGAPSSPSSPSSSLGVTYVAAVSMGYNPTYGNDAKTVEPHLIAPRDHPHRHSSSCGETQLQDFYGEPVRLSVVGYLRPELPFEGLEKLTDAIKGDIVEAARLGGSPDALGAREREWVEGRSEDVLEGRGGEGR